MLQCVNEVGLFRQAHLSKHIEELLQCVAVCCSVLQCVAVCCSVLQCVNVLQDSSFLQSQLGTQVSCSFLEYGQFSSKIQDETQKNIIE